MKHMIIGILIYDETFGQRFVKECVEKKEMSFVVL